ncbi:MAG: CDP-alcohol phosphatidyltransferase family protein [Myxococcota bacterium]
MSAAEPKIAYRVIDRSILLPFYKRWLVDPTLPWIPGRVHPNTITHLGHAANLLGLVVLLATRATIGWPFFVAALCLQLYLWCDNADGAHARRTQQTSVYGEFLDHGLDQLNTAYIGSLTAIALGAPPAWWVATALITPGAAVLTYWEQSVTGVFRLGLLNQVESLIILTLALLVSGLFGSDIYSRFSLGPITLQLLLLVWPAATILFGVARHILRVWRAAGASTLPPILAYTALSSLIVLGFVEGALELVPAVLAGSALAVYYGMHMLSQRMRGEKPRLTWVLQLALIPLGIAAASPGASYSNLAAIGAAVLFGAFALVETARGLRRLAELGGLLLAVVGALSWGAPAEAGCLPRAELEAKLGKPTEAPLALEHLVPKAPLNALEFPAAKGERWVASAERACPFALDALELFSAPASAEGLEEWARRFSPGTVLEYPWPLLRAIVREGGLQNLGSELPLGVVVERAPSGIASVRWATAALEETASVVLLHRASISSRGAYQEKVTTLARLEGGGPRSSGPGPALSPEAMAKAKTQREHLQAALTEATTLVPVGDRAAARAKNDAGYQSLKEGKLEEGLAALRAAVAADPSYGQAHYNLACALGRLRSANKICEHQATAPAILEELQATMKLFPSKWKKLTVDPDLAAVRDTFEFGILSGEHFGRPSSALRLLTRTSWYQRSEGAFGPASGLRLSRDGSFTRWRLVVPDDGPPKRISERGRFRLSGGRLLLEPAAGPPVAATVIFFGRLDFEDGTVFISDADECNA